MKKVIIVLLIGFAASVSLSMCDKPCNEEQVKYLSEIRELRISRNNDIYGRFKMSFSMAISEVILGFNLPSGFILEAKAYNPCPPAPLNLGLKYKISTMLLVCDKPIGGFEAGYNLISQITKSGSKYLWTVDEWIEAINKGVGRNEMGGWLYFHSDSDYDFDIITMLPEDDLVDNEYTLTFRIDYVSGESSYVETFSLVMPIE